MYSCIIHKHQYSFHLDFNFLFGQKILVWRWLERRTRSSMEDSLGQFYSCRKYSKSWLKNTVPLLVEFNGIYDCVYNYFLIGKQFQCSSIEKCTTRNHELQAIRKLMKLCTSACPLDTIGLDISAQTGKQQRQGV